MTGNTEWPKIQITRNTWVKRRADDWLGPLRIWLAYTNELRGARTRRFITAFTTTRQRSLSSASWIHSAPPPPANLPKVHFDPIFPSTPWSFKWSLSLGSTHQNPVHACALSHACHMPRPPHSPWFDVPNNIWWWIQITKLPIVQLSPFSRYFIPHRSKYCPPHSVLKHPQSMLFPQC
jgi:hypothetical protein